MVLLSATNISKQYLGREVLARLNFRIEEGDRIGLVGPNGEGKTTLLRIVAGLEEPDTGGMDRRQGLRIGVLPQQPPPMDDVPLREFLRQGCADLLAMEAELAALAERLTHHPEDAELMERFSARQAEFEHRGGYTLDTRLDMVLTGLGFPRERFATSAAHLSGGERTRAFLGRLLLEDPGLLLLDEPTNHLDLAAVEWLENWLAESERALLIVSHDRYFLDKVTRRTWDLARAAIETYRGGYSDYVRQREERRLTRMREWEAQQAYVERTEEFVRRHLAGQRTKEAQGRRTRLERFLADEAVPKPAEARRIHIRLDEAARGPERIFLLRNLEAGYVPGRPLVRIREAEVWRGQRIAIVGPNGAGKTTLLRTLLGQLPPLAGEVRRGPALTCGYLAQASDGLDPAHDVLDAFRSVDPKMNGEEARTRLGAFLFSGDDVYKKVGVLSGGERSRLVLARIAALGANLLFLDEPTNHLDIPSQEILQEALAEFDGTILLVSHDRYLVQALATHLWILSDGGIEVLPGRWQEYLAWREAQSAAPSPEKAERTARDEEVREERKVARRRERQRERLEQKHAELESGIARLEKQLHTLGEQIAAKSTVGEVDEVRRLGTEYQAADTQLKATWEEWIRVGQELEALAKPEADAGTPPPPGAL